MFRLASQVPPVTHFAEVRPFRCFALSASFSDPPHFCDGFRLSSPSTFTSFRADTGVVDHFTSSDGFSIHSKRPEDSLYRAAFRSIASDRHWLLIAPTIIDPMHRNTHPPKIIPVTKALSSLLCICHLEVLLFDFFPAFVEFTLLF